MSVPDADQSTHDTMNLTEKQLNSFNVTSQSVLKELKSLDTSKATGPDGVSPHILKNCAQQLAAPLAALFTNCLKQKRWPKLWKKASVVAVHKKDSKNEVKNYRPISLLSIIGKIFERLIAAEVTRFLDENFLLSNRQFGFRGGRSTSDLMLQLSSGWQKSLDEGEDTVVIALDISGAFDRVWHGGLTTKLQGLGIRGNLLDLITNYLHERSLSVVLNGRKSSERFIKASVPQGSVLGPLLWNVYFNDLLQLVPQATAYADDCTVCFRERDFPEGNISEHINRSLQTMKEWSEKWKINFAPNKTQAMVISRQRTDRSLRRPLIMGGVEIKLAPSIRLLGITVDEKLTFASHVREIAARASRKLSSIRRISSLLDHNGCCILYKSQVRPMMEYCPLTWSSCSKSHSDLLEVVQRRAKRLIDSKAPTGSSGLKLQPLQHRREVSALCVFYKVHRLNLLHLSALNMVGYLSGDSLTFSVIRLISVKSS